MGMIFNAGEKKYKRTHRWAKVKVKGQPDIFLWHRP